jgi:hypothetical protein
VSPVPGALPNFTTVAPVRFIPVMVTTVPPAIGPVAGLMPVMVGASTAVTIRSAVVAAAAVAVGGRYNRKDHPPAVGTTYEAVNVPLVLVVPVVSVVQALEVDGRRCTLTVRATYPVPVLTDTASVSVAPTATLAEAVAHPDTDVAAPVTPVTMREPVVRAAAVAVAGTSSRKYQTPVPGTVYAAVYTPVLEVVPEATVVQALDVDARRCTLTDRATYPVPVLTDTASLTTYPTAPLVAVVDHPDTAVVAPVTPVTFRELVVADVAVLVAFTDNRKYHTPVPGTE